MSQESVDSGIEDMIAKANRKRREIREDELIWEKEDD